jgi:hypothetical protein
MELNPKASLERLEQCLRAYRRPFPQHHDEMLQNLKAAISRAEIKSSNLGHKLAGDPAAQALYRQLLTMTQLAQGTVKEQKTLLR